MARWTEQNRKPVDELIATWRTTCLVEDGSLRGAGAVWTAENTAVLVAEFVDKPLEDSKTTFLHNPNSTGRRNTGLLVSDP